MLRLYHLVVMLTSLSMILASNYDASLAKEYFYYSCASYCRQSKIVDWSCGQPCQTPRPVDLLAFYNKTADTSGYAAYNPSRKQIMVVFRGTVASEIVNWMSDIDYKKVPYPLCDNGCQVHRGFHECYMGLNQQVLAHVQTLKKKYPSAGLLVAGHSLGAALATHALLYLLKNGYKVDHLMTYGSPRVGDKKFSDYLKKTFTGIKYRVTHSRDPVPHLPVLKWGFEHINTEIFYPATPFVKDVYTVCDDVYEEDGNCSDQNPSDLVFTDHFRYFDIDQSVTTKQCQ